MSHFNMTLDDIKGAILGDGHVTTWYNIYIAVMIQYRMILTTIESRSANEGSLFVSISRTLDSILPCIYYKQTKIFKGNEK